MEFRIESLVTVSKRRRQEIDSMAHDQLCMLTLCLQKILSAMKYTKEMGWKMSVESIMGHALNFPCDYFLDNIALMSEVATKKLPRVTWHAK
jgi:hypothetical protein